MTALPPTRSHQDQPAFTQVGELVQLPGIPLGAGWCLSVCPAAGEAGGSFRYAPRIRVPRDFTEPTGDPERSMSEAARRARGKVRRYCVANGLNRFATLTYAGAGCHDQRELRGHVGEFFRGLRDSLGGKPFPYAWTSEWHKTDHGLHAHFAVGRYVPRGKIDTAWGRGWVHIKLLGDLPVGSGAKGEARVAAGYLSKYVGKNFDDRRIPGLHRYDVAEGFQPEIVHVWGRTADEAIDVACGLMGGVRPERRWSSADEKDWDLPPSVWVQWPA